MKKIGKVVEQRQTTKDKPAITVGLDLGDRYSRYCLLNEECEVVEEGRIQSTETAFRRHFEGEPPQRVALECRAAEPADRQHGSADRKTGRQISGDPSPARNAGCGTGGRRRALDISTHSSPSGPKRHRAQCGSLRVRIEARDESQRQLQMQMQKHANKGKNKNTLTQPAVS